MLGSRLAYTICMLLATIVAGVLLRRQQSDIALTSPQKWGVAIGGLVGATFAAKIPFIIGDTPTLGLVGAWLSDGKTILWGLAGGYLGVELAKWAMLIKTKTGDSFVFRLRSRSRLVESAVYCSVVATVSKPINLGGSRL